MSKFHLVLLIHAHQPVGNFDSVIDEVYSKSYLPFVEHLELHPNVRIGLHYSGCLLQWIEEHHPEYIEKLQRMVARQQVEIVGGGYYEPILVSIPPARRPRRRPRSGTRASRAARCRGGRGD